MSQTEDVQQPIQQIIKPKIFAGVRAHWKYVVKASALALIFWLLQFSYHFFIAKQPMDISLVRSFAFSGATLISIALIIGPLARLSKRNYIFHRRTFGVWGFTFIIMHVLSAMSFYFNWNAEKIFTSSNPFVNPLLFGLAAFVIFIPLYVTSTDWTAQKLRFRRWKAIHRLVYVAYIFTVLHYALINPAALYQPFGYLLVAVTVIAFALQLAAFIKVSKLKLKKDTLIGIVIILFAVLLFGYAFFGR